MRIHFPFMFSVAVGSLACASTQTPQSACAAVPCSQAHAPGGAELPVRTGSVHDFDALDGAWLLDNRRLKVRFVGSQDWDEFPAVSCGRIHLDGVASTDEIYYPTKGWGGVTVRTFDTAKKQWSIYWVNSREGKLYPPVVGGFDGDRGEFYGEDTDEGKPVKVRFVWLRTGPETWTWEQAFSTDGKEWEVNWTNTLTRPGDPAVCQDGRPRK